jgi:hypothetical protein
VRQSEQLPPPNQLAVTFTVAIVTATATAAVIVASVRICAESHANGAQRPVDTCGDGTPRQGRYNGEDDANDGPLDHFHSVVLTEESPGKSPEHFLAFVCAVEQLVLLRLTRATSRAHQPRAEHAPGSMSIL